MQCGQIPLASASASSAENTQHTPTTMLDTDIRNPIKPASIELHTIKAIAKK